MERKIGEIFEYNGDWYQCLPERRICDDCAFKNDITCKNSKGIRGECQRLRRQKDGVIFKKLEKVGEPYVMTYCKENILVQEYKLFCKVTSTPSTPRTFRVSFKDAIEIELKQNQEYMEENENNRGNCSECGDTRFEVIARAKEDLFKSTNIESDEKEMAVIDNILFRCYQMGWLDRYEDEKLSNYENIEKNVKEFNIKAAKSGKPVCTRDGRKARIICFDYKSSDDYSIIALVDNGDNEMPYKFSKEGKFNLNCTDAYDLMMLPEKKEGWAVIYKDDLLRTEKEARELAEQSISEVIRIEKIEWEE